MSSPGVRRYASLPGDPARFADKDWMRRIKPGDDDRRSGERHDAQAQRLRSPLIALIALAGPAFAQDAVDLAKAKAEGKVVWYTSTPLPQAPEDRQPVREGTRHQGRAVPLRRLGDAAPLPAGDRRRPHRRRRADHLRSGGGRDADAQGRVRRVQAEELRQDPGRRQGQGRQLRRPAAQPDDELPAHRQGRRRPTSRRPGTTSPTRNTRASW